MLDLFVALPAVALLLCWVWRRIDFERRRKAFSRDHGCLPPVNASRFDPILGIYHTFNIARASAKGRHLQNLHDNLFSKYGNSFSMLVMGQPILLTNDPRNLQAILATQFGDFEIGTRRRDVMADLLGVGIFNADGDAWAHARATIRPNLTRKQFTDVVLFEKHFQVWMNHMPVGQGKLLDVQEWVFRFTLDVGTELLCDKSADTLHPEGAAAGHRFGWAIDTACDVISVRMQLGKLWRLYGGRDNREACQAVRDYIDPMVHEAVKRAKLAKQLGDGVVEDDPRYTFLGALANEGLGAEEISSHVLNMLFAARASTASLISSVIRLLAENTRVQTRLRHEIQDSLNGRLPTYEDVRNLTYLNYIIKETLRLYPPAPQSLRAAIKDTTLPVGGGPDGTAPVFIPKGGEVGFIIYSTHRRTDIWGDDADQFRPERWETVKPLFQYLPFNAGPRICPGQSLAQAEAGYVIARFLQEYSVLKPPNPPRPYREYLHISLAAKGGVWVTVDR
ncbi:cytochrome P450 [Hypoxylon rubiginosum]|uniref:Cytochrome P450 n=1 Tax=Hypoxylon rubiginosum TaxID=110542 RepID=A0ACC0DLL1_9PEZI|nr:cytochrome P450 [Hypoxylon rubiginosum]